MSRYRSKSTAWIGFLVFAAGNILVTRVGHAEDRCDKLVPLPNEIEIDVFRAPTGYDKGPPVPVKSLGEIKCLEEKNGRYHIRSSAENKDYWVPMWELAKSGSPDPLQQLLRPPNDFAAPVAQHPSRGANSSLAVSPTHRTDQSTPAPSTGQSPKLEDLLRKGAEPPSAK
jgi:hypothetical protein